jgi:hypothetical protein
VLFGSCSEEKEVFENQTSKISSQYISFKELKNNPLAFSEFQKTENKIAQAKNSKLVYNSEYGFSIDTEKILYIEKGGYHSYTLPILRDGENQETENLVLSLNKDNQYDAYITKYDLSDFEKEKIINNEYIDVTQKTEISILEIEPIAASCFEMITVPASTNEQGQVTSSYVYAQEIPCPGGGSGGEGGGSSDGGSGSGTGSGNDGSNSDDGWIGSGSEPNNGESGGGGAGSGGTSGSTGTGSGTGPILIDLEDPPVVITSPIIKDLILLGILNENLKQLNDITNDATKPYKSKITVLQQSLTDPLEKGFEFRIEQLGEMIPYQMPSTPTGVHFPIPLRTSLVRMHNHTNSLDPIFSAEDISAMAEFFAVKDDLGATDSNDIMSLMITRTGAFALKIDNSATVTDFLNELKTGMDEKGKPMNDIYEESYLEFVIDEAQKQCNGTCTDTEYNSYLEAKFIAWLYYWNTGIGYYKGTLNADGTYTWVKIN